MSGLPTLPDHAFLFSFGAVERELVRDFTARFAMLVVNVTGDVVLRALDGSNKVIDASIHYMSYVTDTVRTRDTPFVLVVGPVVALREGSAGNRRCLGGPEFRMELASLSPFCFPRAKS